MPQHSVAFVPAAGTASAQPGFSIHALKSSGQLRQSARRLVSQRYAQRGYLRMPWATADEPQLLTLSAAGEGGTLGTLGVRLDSAQGLKADEVFPEEMRALRAAGRRLCEFTQLALEHGTISTPVLAGLFHAAHLYAHRMQQADRLVIEVNPRHVGYYRRMLGFEVCSEVRMNPRVNAPAVLMALDLVWGEQQVQTCSGGRSGASSRSLYPHFFDPSEERRLLASLQAQIAGA